MYWTESPPKTSVHFFSSLFWICPSFQRMAKCTGNCSNGWLRQSWNASGTDLLNESFCRPDSSFSSLCLYLWANRSKRGCKKQKTKLYQSSWGKMSPQCEQSTTTGSVKWTEEGRKNSVWLLSEKKTLGEETRVSFRRPLALETVAKTLFRREDVCSRWLIFNI